MTPRYVLWLVGQLPPTSALRASQMGGHEHRPWSLEAYLLAATVNLLNAANRQRAGKKTLAPLVKTPAMAKPKPRRVSVAGVAARQRALASKQTD